MNDNKQFYSYSPKTENKPNVFQWVIWVNCGTTIAGILSSNKKEQT